MLRNRLEDADLKQQPAVLSFDVLNQLMKNMNREQFNFDTFKAAYDADPQIQQLVKNFDQQEVTLDTSVGSDEGEQVVSDNNKAVNQMAKRATRRRQ